MAKNAPVSEVTGVTKAAVLLIALGPEKSAKLFKHLKEEEIEQLTKDKDGHIFNICFNYGGRLDIIDATKKIVNDCNNGVLDINELDEEIYIKYLYNEIPDIDLLIRTSGEFRISNYMLYQISYAEMYFTNTLFPDFNEKEFDKAIESFNSRDRRYGGINKNNIYKI